MFCIIIGVYQDHTRALFRGNYSELSILTICAPSESEGEGRGEEGGGGGEGRGGGGGRFRCRPPLLYWKASVMLYTNSCAYKGLKT